MWHRASGTTVARKVLSAQFSRAGSVLKLTPEVQAAAGETGLKSVDVYGSASVMERCSTRQEGQALVVLLVLAAIAVPLILSGIDFARGLSVGDGQGKGISISQYAAMTADAIVAQTTNLVDGAAPEPSATLTWTDDDEGFHYAHYAVVDGEVLREHDGLTTTVAKRVTAARFSREGKTLIFKFDLESADGAQTKHIEVFARSLQ